MTYDIKIEEVFNGYIVTIGCQRFVFGGCNGMAEALTQLTIALNAYLTDRDGAEKVWRERFGREVSTPHSEHRHDLSGVDWGNSGSGTVTVADVPSTYTDLDAHTGTS